MTSRLAPKQDFFSHLKYTKTCHVLITAETDDFDELIIQEWRNEGFVVSYLGFGDGGANFVRRVQGHAGSISVGEQYAIIAYGAPATPLLLSLRHLPRLVCLVAYQPPQIPAVGTTSYPASVRILLHLAANSTIAIAKRPEVLGIQGKNVRLVHKTIPSGAGLGGSLELGQAAQNEVRTYVYEGVRPGFADPDDDDNYDPVAKELAWGRSLAAVREGFDLPHPDLEDVRDRWTDEAGGGDPEAACKGLPVGVGRINLPTLTGGFDAEGLRTFYRDLFGPSAPYLRARLISRTVGNGQCVDEMLVSFNHDRVVQWILPGVPPTGKKVKVVMLSVVAIKGGRVVAERVYWDQASVLVQVGMLDPKLVPDGFAGKAGKAGKGKCRMPVVGVEQANAVEWGEDWEGNINELCGKVAGTRI